MTIDDPNNKGDIPGQGGDGPGQSRRELLLADRATEGLDRLEQSELTQLGEAQDDISYDLAAAAVHLALLDKPEKPSELLEQRLRNDARAFFAGRESASESRPAGSSRWPVYVAVAATCAAAVILFLWLSQAPGSSGIPEPTIADVNPVEQRARLLNRAGDTVILPWQATDDATAEGASGDVVWSDSEQEGYMRIRGLSANDPQDFQYQLWIFDPNRDERYPVDGGVFDIPAGVSEVVIPITARLAVRTPSLFAITVENPGGVVVSSRERIALLAKAS